MLPAHHPSDPVYRPDGGFTFLELLVLLTVLAVLLPPLVGLGVDLRDQAAVSSAVEDAAAILTRGRWSAVATGGATVGFVVSPPAGWAVNRTGDTVLIHRFADRGVTLTLSRGRPSALLRFGPLGLGMVSSQTLTFVRGGHRQALVVSAFGRVRRGE